MQWTIASSIWGKTSKIIKEMLIDIYRQWLTLMEFDGYSLTFIDIDRLWKTLLICHDDQRSRLIDDPSWWLVQFDWQSKWIQVNWWLKSVDNPSWFMFGGLFSLKSSLKNMAKLQCLSPCSFLDYPRKLLTSTTLTP